MPFSNAQPAESPYEHPDRGVLCQRSDGASAEHQGGHADAEALMVPLHCRCRLRASLGHHWEPTRSAVTTPSTVGKRGLGEAEELSQAGELSHPGLDAQ